MTPKVYTLSDRQSRVKPFYSTDLHRSLISCLTWDRCSEFHRQLCQQYLIVPPKRFRRHRLEKFIERRAGELNEQIWHALTTPPKIL